MNKKLWTKSEIEILKKDYPSISSINIAVKLNRNLQSVYYKANKLGLYKNDEFKSSESSGRIINSDLGKEFRFKKGAIPPNKGKKLTDYLESEAIDKILKTSFKKGNLPHNTLSDGFITNRFNKKSNRMYKHIRLSLGKWQMLHVYNWEKIHGKVPKGSVVVFKTLSTEDCNVENLMLLTRRENMIRNSLHRYPEEIKKTIRTLTKLKKIINGKK